MSTLLKNGYYKVTKQENGELAVALRAANNKTLSQATGLDSWETVRGNILAQIRANNGRECIMVDATGGNAMADKVYYRLQVVPVEKNPKGYVAKIVSNTEALDAQVDSEEEVVYNAVVMGQVKQDAPATTQAAGLEGLSAAAKAAVVDDTDQGF